jgi:hypothetical protein
VQYCLCACVSLPRCFKGQYLLIYLVSPPHDWPRAAGSSGQHNVLTWCGGRGRTASGRGSYPRQTAKFGRGCEPRQVAGSSEDAILARQPGTAEAPILTPGTISTFPDKGSSQTENLTFQPGRWGKVGQVRGNPRNVFGASGTPIHQRLIQPSQFPHTAWLS